MTTTTPRVRNDLKSTPAQDAGVNYVDISDPRSGGSLRMYTFEWRIAERMDGRTSYADLATWARSEFEWQPSAEDLASYAKKLHELGFIDGDLETAPISTRSGSDTTLPDSKVPSIPEATMEIESDKIIEASDEEDGIEEADERPASVEISFTPGSVEALGRTEPARVDSTPAPVSIHVESEPAPLPPVTHGEPAPQHPTSPAEVESGRRVSEPPAKRPRGKALPLVLGLLAAGGAAAYFLVIAPMMQPMQVTAAAAPAPSTVTRFYEKAAKITRSEPTTVKTETGGTVLEVAAKAGEDAKPGMVLLTLNGISPIEKQIHDVADRLKFYESKNDTVKIAEKKKIIEGLEADAAKLKITTNVGGTIAEVMTTPGATINPGDPIAKIVDARRTVEFALAPSEAAAMKVGQVVKLVGPGGATGEGKVAQVGAAEVRVEVTGEAVKPGDEVQLVKGEMPHIVRIPATSVIKSQGGADQVFVAENGEAHARPVTVAEKEGKDALVSSGLNGGEQVLITFPGELQDGQRIAVGAKQ